MRRPRVVGALAVLAAVLVLCAGCAGPSAGRRAPAVPVGRITVVADADVPADWAARVRAEVTSAVGDVVGLLPGSWSRQVETRLVASDDRLRAVAGWAAGGDSPAGTVAAVAVLPVPAATSAPRTLAGEGGRLVVDLDVYRRLTADGRRIVLRHELTHLATAAETPAGMPVWLVEGFAEEVGHEGVVVCSARFPALPAGPRCPTVPASASASGSASGSASVPASGLTVDRAAAELAGEVRAGQVPTALPADAAFDGSDGRLAQTYQEAWLACRLLAERLGLAGLARFYREVGARLAASTRASEATAVAGGSGLDDARTQALAAALRDEAAPSWPEFVADWPAFLTTVLAGPGSDRSDG
jgi:hypothetical protein